MEPHANSSQNGSSLAQGAHPLMGPGLHPAATSFAGEITGSLAEMAQRDLDAALQLLANRAQYITGASGVAIALRREGKDEMLCRATTGSNAPELGALFSTEFGLSGESVRTRQALRCDDAERDARVNREVCRQMGIASVVVMPVVNDDGVLGIFELFSGKANAFGARDVSAVQRLSEMVETAVRLAQAARTLPEMLKKDEISAQELETGEVLLDVEEPSITLVPSPSTSPAEAPSQSARRDGAAVVEEAPASRKNEAKKKLFWSAALHPASEVETAEDVDQSHVPPGLMSLRKCEACGFPVSAGRTLCVECEEKKWRGQLGVPKAGAGGVTAAASSVVPATMAPKAEMRAFAAAQSAGSGVSMPSIERASSMIRVSGGSVPATTVREFKATEAPTGISSAAFDGMEPAAAKGSPEFVLSAGLEPAQSWFATHKYIVGVLLVVGAVVAAIFLVR
ncbi:MAG TPA: GAF domain-containing protein [Candidatus Sulfotelmatobacter sp.]|jgi:hypothetical protein